MARADECLLRVGQTVVFEGDSLTSRRTPPCLDDWPYLRLSNWQRTYAEEVAEWLFCNRPDLRLTFHTAAVGGSSCVELRERYEQRVKPLRPAWVILTLGGNDSARKVPLGEFRRTLDEYCRQLA